VLVDPIHAGGGKDDLADAIAIRFRQAADQAGAGESSRPAGPTTAIPGSGTLPQPGRWLVACGACLRSPLGNRQEKSNGHRRPHVCAGCHRIPVRTPLAAERYHKPPRKPDQPGRTKESQPLLATVPPGVSSPRWPGRNH
jgi:hypothetical protein